MNMNKCYILGMEKPIQNDDLIRINKYLSQAGILSRRKADEAIEAGLVTLNGETAVAGDKVGPGDSVCYKGKPVGSANKEKVILAYNKPLGLVCTSKEADKDSIFHHIDYPGMLYYVGRLDKNSQGLLLLTNDGELANKIQKARNNHEKEYVVRVDKPVTEEFLKGMSDGVMLDRMTKKCKVKKISTNTFNIIITEGINRQIRRMCECFDYRVVFLKRIRVMNIKLGNLEKGAIRKLTKQEEEVLRKLCN